MGTSGANAEGSGASRGLIATRLADGIERSPLRVLLIEDNPADAHLLKEALLTAHVGAEFRLEHVETLEDGLARLAMGTFDLTLLDLNLPDSDGIRTFLSLREHSPELATVVLSSASDEELAMETVRAGAQDYLFKESLVENALVVRTIRYARARALNQQKLQAAEARLRTVLESTSDAIVIVDSDRVIRFANRAAGELLGSDGGGPVGSRFDAPLDPSREVETELTARDGRTIPVSVRATTTDWGERPAHCVSLQDISARKAAATAKSQFLASISHEIRTPLSAIVGMTGLLKETSLTDEQKRYVTTFEKAARGLSALVSDLIDLSKMEVGEMKLERVSFDVGEVVENVCALMAVRAEEKGLELTYAVASDVKRKVLGDPNRLTQVLFNLLNNAVKFTEMGTVSLRVDRDPYGAVDRLLFSVADTGIGIERKHWEHIFESFKQVDPAENRRRGGVGLGLAIARQLVGLMDGKIWVQSEPGRGSTFFVRVPLECQSEQRSELEPELDGKRVLLVEDNPVTRTFLCEMLHGWGADVALAVDRSSGWKVWSESRGEFDLALVDRSLPDGDGGDLAVSFRETGAEAVLLLAAYSLTPSDRFTGKSGVAPVMKPIKRGELVKAIRRVMGLTEATPESARLSIAVPSLSGPVLLADDSEDNREVIRAFLKTVAGEVVAAKSGLEAVARFREAPFQVVVMDVQMPDMDGLEATRQIRRLERESGRDHTPVIALTGHARPEDEAACLAAGCDSFLVKPVSKQALFAAFARLRARP